MIKSAKDIPWYLKRKLRKSNIRTDGHSQYGQDSTVMDILGTPQTGVFVDIGANDGVSHSNSLLFEKAGWTGVCIEPHPSIFKQLAENRNCHLLNACISDKDGMVDFLVVEGPGNMLSGIAEFCDERQLRRINESVQNEGSQKKISPIEALSPTSVMKRYSLTSIDYLSIDTEGCEMEILKTFDLETFPPKTIGVENNTRTPIFYHYLKTKGYSLAKCVGCDEIYIHHSVTK